MSMQTDIRLKHLMTAVEALTARVKELERKLEAAYPPPRQTLTTQQYKRQ